MIHNIKSKNNLSSFVVKYKNTVLNETQGIHGISHLTEHLLSKTYNMYDNDFIIDAINSNAYTSNTEVAFYINGLDKKVNKWKNVILDNISNFRKITENEFETEKNVVLEEYQDYFNRQYVAHFFNLNRKLYNFYNPIGLKSDLEKISYNDFINFCEKYFHTPNEIFYVSKNNDINNIKTINNESDFILTKNSSCSDYENINFSENKSSIIICSDILNSDDIYYIKFINCMLSLGLTSPLMQEIRVNKGLTYDINMSDFKYNKNYVFYTSCMVSDKNVDLLIDTYNSILNNREKYLTKEYFNNIKSYFKNRKNINKNYKHSTTDIYDKDSIHNNIENIKYDKLISIYDTYYNTDNMYYSIDKKDFK